jgi:hypothetical protein
MKALTLWRPWAQAIIYGPKRIENRTWRPPRWIIGKRIAIHAGARYDVEGASWMSGGGLFAKSLYEPGPPGECRPGLLGTAVVEGVVTRSTDPWFCGPYGWVLTDVVALPEPIPCRGAQGLWDVPYSLAEQLDKVISYVRWAPERG